MARVEDGALVLETKAAALRRLRARYQSAGGSLADELLEERRLEAAREAE